MEIADGQVKLARNCMRRVRLENQRRMAASQSSCEVADNQAFKLLSKIGRAELSEYETWKGRQNHSKEVVFVDRRCFGAVCYRIPPVYHKRYYPLADIGVGSSSTGMVSTAAR